jgi:hypothetical protein
MPISRLVSGSSASQATATMSARLAAGAQAMPPTAMDAQRLAPVVKELRRLVLYPDRRFTPLNQIPMLFPGSTPERLAMLSTLALQETGIEYGAMEGAAMEQQMRLQMYMQPFNQAATMISNMMQKKAAAGARITGNYK